jgi:hypothetical protein
MPEPWHIDCKTAASDVGIAWPHGGPRFAWPTLQSVILHNANYAFFGVHQKSSACRLPRASTQDAPLADSGIYKPAIRFL